MSSSRRSIAHACLAASLVASLYFASVTQTAAAPARDPAAVQQDAVRQTQALVSLQKNWTKASGPARGQMLNQLVEQAKTRRGYLAELIKTDPQALLNVAIPDRKQAEMPKEVLALLERNSELEGVLEAVDEDYRDGSHKLRHFLNTDFGERFELHFAGKAAHGLNGQRLRISGVLLDRDAGSDLDGHMAADSEQNVLTLELGSSLTGGISDGTSAPTATFGEQKTLVILVNFQDKAEQPYTPEYAQQVIFGDTSDYFFESSYGQTWLSGDVTGWYTLPISSTVCQDNTLRAYANTAAENAGVNLSAYDRLVYAFPQNACAYWGTASVGASPSYTLINGDLEMAVTGHEMGHNFGLYHSHSLVCADGTPVGAGSPDLWSTDPWAGCTNLEYGDGTDTMGWSDTAHTNAFQKERLGWLNDGASPPLTTVTANGSFTLAPYAAQEGSSKALKILKSPADQYGYRTWYYVEFRQAVGFDSTFASATSMMDSNNLLNGVTIHVGYEGNDGNNVYLVDMTPETNSDLYTRDPALPVGATYVDDIAGVSITTEWSDATGATVNVSYGGAQAICVPATPSLSMTPGQSDWLPAGSGYTYTLTLTNNDSNDCADNSFDLSAAIPAGWNGSFANSVLALAPGESVTTTLTVTSAANAVDGFYNVEATAVGGSYGATASATFVVDTPVTNAAPVAVDDSVTIGSKSAVTIAVLANDWDPENDAIYVVGAATPAKGSLKLNADGSLTYTPGKPFKTSDSFTYTISDGRNTAQATVTITLQSTGGTDGSTDSSTPVKGGGKTKKA